MGVLLVVKSKININVLEDQLKQNQIVLILVMI